MINVKRWIIEIAILSLVFAGVGYAAHETKFSGLRVTDLTASRAVVTDAEKDLASSATTATEIGYVSGLSSAVQTQLDVRCLESVFGTALSTGLTLDGTDLKVSPTLQSLTGLTETNGGIPYGTADNAYAWLAAGTAGYLFQGNGAGAPSWVNSISIGAGTFAGVLTVKPDTTNEVFQVNDGSVDFTDGNAGTTGTLTVAATGNLSYNKAITSPNIAEYGTIYIDAGAMVPCTTNPAEAGTNEYGTNDIDMDYMAFDPGATEERIQFKLVMPENWDRSDATMKAKFYWSDDTTGSAAETVEWGIKAGAYANDVAIDTALGTAVTISDTVTASSDMHITSATAVIVVAQAQALGDMIVFEVFRNTDGTDDMDDDAWLFGVFLQYKKDNTISAW